MRSWRERGVQTAAGVDALSVPEGASITSGWDYEGEGLFLESDLRKVWQQARSQAIWREEGEVSGHITSAANPDLLNMVPPG